MPLEGSEPFEPAPLDAGALGGGGPDIPRGSLYGGGDDLRQGPGGQARERGHGRDAQFGIERSLAVGPGDLLMQVPPGGVDI